MRVPSGSLLGVLGPNGSGKTTLLKLLAGLLTPAGGRITLDGHDTARLNRATLARRLAVVPQETQLAFDYTVLEIVLMGRYPHLRAFELEGPADLEIARRMLAATGTATFEQRMFRTLSGGEKQRVVMASALAQFEDSADTGGHGPDETQVLLLDDHVVARPRLPAGNGRPAAPVEPGPAHHHRHLHTRPELCRRALPRSGPAA